MASELHVDAIKHSGGTSAMTINSSGVVHIPGHVIQTTHVADTTISRHSSSSTSYTATGLIGTITPKFADSKIIVRFASSINTNTSSNHMVVYTIYRDIASGGYSNLRATTNHYGIGQVYGDDRVQCPLLAELIDTTHSTTSAITYKVYTRSVQGIAYEIPNTTEEHYECIIQEIAV